ncbi:hypothetical protein LXL04_038895 [Taraxacum kok-saghyz]
MTGDPGCTPTCGSQIEHSRSSHKCKHSSVASPVEANRLTASKAGGSGSDTCEDDVSVDHEVDDEVIQIPNCVDPFLSKNNLIPIGGVAVEVEDEVTKFPIHDPNQKWDTMKPILGI